MKKVLFLASALSFSSFLFAQSADNAMKNAPHDRVIFMTSAEFMAATTPSVIAAQLPAPQNHGKLVDYEITRMTKGGDVITYRNESPFYSEQALQIIKMAEKDDTYYFDNVNMLYGHEATAQKVRPIIVRIK